MQYRYTLRGGYDRLIKKKVEKGTLFAVPLAILAIVGIAALTSNTTSGPGIGSSSKGTSGQSTVTRTFQNTAANDQTTASSGSAESTTSGSSTQGSTGSSSTNGTSSSPTRTIQPSSGTTTGTTSGATSNGSGSSGGSGTTIVPPAPLPPPPVTVCVKGIDPLTGLCVN